MFKSILGLVISILPVTVGALAQAPEGPGEKYALIIGIKGYPGFPEDERLKFADADALLFKNFLQTPEGGSFQEQNIRILLNENAKRDDIRQRGLNWLGEGVHKDDLVYVFFAGQGVVNPDDYSVYFMPYDGRKSDPEGMGILSSDFLRRLKSKIDPRHLIVFIDACHAAAAATADGTARDAADTSASLSANWRNAFKDSEETHMAFFSTSANQRSWEDNELGHGVFTWFLIKGLKGEADKDNNGDLTAGELHLYLLEKVPEYTARKFRREQTPMLSQRFSPSFQLAKINAEDWFEKGLRAFASKDYGEALGHFTKAIERNSQHKEAYLLRGRTKSSLGDKQGAIDDYTRFIELEPQAAGAYIERGDAKYALGNKQGTIADYGRAIELDPKFAWAYNIRGNIKSDLGDKQGAIDDYTRFIELDPQAAGTYHNRGIAKAALGNKQGSIADYDKVIELEPKAATAYYDRGHAKFDLENFHGAIADYTKVIELEPQAERSYYSRGNAKSALGDMQGAIADFDKAIELDPKYAWAYGSRGNARYDLGNKHGAIADYDRVIELDPQDAKAYYNRGNAKSDVGERQGAIADWISAARLGDEKARKWLTENGYSWQ